MAVSIIYLIIILVILRKVLKDKKKTVKPKNTAPPPKRPPAAQTVQRPQNKGNLSRPKTDYQEQQKMRDLKQRLKEKYTPAPRSEILENAKENVAENDVDLLKEADRRWHDSARVPALHTQEDTDILKQVYDLMIVGYSGNLNFKRDFLSEGMDMINRIGMTENNMDIIEYKINGSI